MHSYLHLTVPQIDGTDVFEKILNKDEVNVSSVYEDTLSQDESDDSEENSSDDEQEASSFQRTEKSTRSRENNKLMFKEAGLTVENVMSMVRQTFFAFWTIKYFT